MNTIFIIFSEWTIYFRKYFSWGFGIPKNIILIYDSAYSRVTITVIKPSLGELTSKYFWDMRNVIFFYVTYFIIIISKMLGNFLYHYFVSVTQCKINWNLSFCQFYSFSNFETYKKTWLKNYIFIIIYVMIFLIL